MHFAKHLAMIVVGACATWASLGVAQGGPSSASTTTLSPSLLTVFTSGASSVDTFAATVTTNATGTVTFKDLTTNANLTCSEGPQPRPLSNSETTCSATFSTEGIHVLSATYSGDGTFNGSTGTANIYALNHSTNPSGTTYCNAGPVSSTGLSSSAYSATAPYPSAINVSGISNTVSSVSVQLKGYSATAGALTRLLLVSPDGKGFDFWDGAGTTITAGNYTLQDGTAQILQNSSTSPGTYGPTATSNPSSIAFSPGPPLPAPQLPGSFGIAAPAGSATFETAFSGATGNGNWSLFLWDGNGTGDTAGLTGGWCITITAATGSATTTTVTSSANPNATLGTSVSFTATVPGANQGVVTFTENGAPLAGAPNSGVANVGAGTATISTSQLPEGDHTITAAYSDPAHSFNDSFGTVPIRIDKATATTFNAGTWTYCNSAGIALPAGTVTGLNDIGPAGPNPSNVMVSNLPGTISAATLTLKGFNYYDVHFLQSLLVGPNGASAQGQSQTLDFFTNNGSASGLSAQNTTFTDSGSGIATGVPGPSQKPESFGSDPSFTASQFFTLPGTVNRAASAGSATFASAYSNTDGNGVWSLYFDQTTHNTASGGATGWCMNFIVNAVTGNGTTSHTGPAPNNHMRQGGTGSVTFSLLNNGTGPTGDPDGSHPLVVAGTLPSDLTYGTLPSGSPWSCSAVLQNLTCVNHNAIAQGSTYSPLVIPVNVSSTAGASDTISGFTFSGGGMTASTFSFDPIAIDPAPVLGISKSHTGTFTQGSTATWTLQVFNTSGTAAGATDGSTVTVTDALPTNYTVNQVSAGVNWNCSTSTTTVVTCTSNQVIAGAGGLFPLISVLVNVPANSTKSVTNNASVYGGGDVSHSSSSPATTFETLNVVQVPASISLTTGNNSTATVNTAFVTSLSVTVLDANLVAINGVTVTFTAPASGASGTFSSGTNVKTATTNTSGVAVATTYSANTIAGAYNISVSAGSITNTFSETNIAGAPSQMSANIGTTPQTANTAAAFSNALAVTVLDSFNNPVSGVAVTFTAPSTGASGTFANGTNTTSAITGASGVATATAFTANGTTGGPYTVSASASALTANFSLTNSSAGPTVVSYSVKWGSAGIYNVTGSSRTRLPWQITSIQVVFSAPITSGDINSLSGNGITSTGFTGLGTNTLTWTFGAIPLGNISTTLAGSGAHALKDSGGNGLSAGAGFSKALKILYGDYNDDGVVNSVDLVGVQIAISSAYSVFADLNGDGIVNVADYSIVRTRLGTTLP